VTPTELARARGRLWSLLGRLLLVPPDDGVAAAVAAVPSLTMGQGDLGARHYAALVDGVSPHASVFLGATGHLGEFDVRALYGRVGFVGTVPDAEPDHAGVVCYCLAFLADAEADALEDGRTDQAARVRQAAEAALSEVGMPWFPRLAGALVAQGDALYAGVGTMLAELAGSYGVEATVAFGEPVDVSGLRRMVDSLLVPSRSGMVWERGGIRRLGRAFDVGTGFGSRRQMLRTVIEGGASAGSDVVVRGLLDEIGHQRRALAGIAGADAWTERLDQTADAVASLA
jgi:hypothetical protein